MTRQRDCAACWYRIPQYLTVISGSMGTGKTTTVINLAAALARNGKHVLVIDENAGANNLALRWVLSAHRDLLDVIRRDKTLDEVIISWPRRVLHSAGGARHACAREAQRGTIRLI